VSALAKFQCGHNKNEMWDSLRIPTVEAASEVEEAGERGVGQQSKIARTKIMRRRTKREESRFEAALTQNAVISL
jgi:hypothetical protein